MDELVRLFALRSALHAQSDVLVKLKINAYLRKNLRGERRFTGGEGI